MDYMTTLMNRLMHEIGLYLAAYDEIRKQPKPESIYIREAGSTDWERL